MDIIKTKKALSFTYLSSFCMELALILNAGISINDGLTILYEDENDKQSKQLLEHISSEVNDGRQLDAVLKEDVRFPSYMTHMIEIGSQTGKLEQVLRNLAAYYNNQENIKNHIRNAVIYPSVLLLLMLIVIFLLITKVLPLFAGVFTQLGSSLSPLAQILLSIGNGIQNYIAVIVIILLSLIAASIIIFTNSKLRDAFNKKIVTSIFSKRKVSIIISSAKFADALSICMSCGMDIDKSLQLTSKINTNPTLAKKINDCIALLAQGVSSSEAFIKSQIFSSLYGRMLAVGYKTGSADEVMREIAVKLQTQAWDEINSSINRVEPALVIILSVIVGVILLSVMIPLMSIMSAIG